MVDEIELNHKLNEVRTWLTQAEDVVIVTGAGISTESGIPDFRGPQGVWTRDPDAEKLSNIHYYLSDPEIRKKAWRSRLDSPAWSAQPNAGHRALVELEKRDQLDTLITQNIDGLHLLAGNSPERVIEIHGTIREVVCMNCSDRNPARHAMDRLKAGEEDPSCRLCGGILKSATISFGQNLVKADLIRAEHAARDCDLLLAIGTTLSVHPIAAIVPIAKRTHARIVIINGGPTEMDSAADVVLRGSIGELLAKLAE